MWFNINDAGPPSPQHIINSISARPVQVTLIFTILYKPGPTLRNKVEVTLKTEV